MATSMVGVILDGCGKKSIDEGGLAQSRLTSYHDGKGSATLCDDFVPVYKLIEGEVELMGGRIPLIRQLFAIMHGQKVLE